MILSSHVRVCCILLSLTVGASCSTPAEREIPRRSIKPHSFHDTSLQPDANSLEEQPLASFAQAGLANPERDTSCIHRDNLGSKTPSSTILSNIESAERCQQECSEDLCSHFTYNANTRKCFLKAEIPQFYKMAGDVTGPPTCDTSCHRRNFRYNTSPLQEFKWEEVGGPLDCQSACYAHQRCRVFTWYEDEKMCRLYDSGFSSHKEKAERVVTGPAGFCSDGGSLIFAEVIDGDNTRCIKGPNIKSVSPKIGELKTPLLAECIEACEKTQFCTHFSFTKSTETCLLQKREPDYYFGRGAVTGTPDCDVEYVEDPSEDTPAQHS